MTPHPANEATTVQEFDRQMEERERRERVKTWLREAKRAGTWRRVGDWRWERISDKATFDLDAVARHNGKPRPLWAVWEEAGGLPEMGEDR